MVGDGPVAPSLLVEGPSAVPVTVSMDGRDTRVLLKVSTLYTLRKKTPSSSYLPLPTLLKGSSWSLDLGSVIKFTIVH